MKAENKRDILLVGAGNVASHLASALTPRLMAVFSRSIDHARTFAAPLGIEAGCDFSKIAGLKPDIILVSIADKGIADVAAAIGRLDYDPLIVHTSGTVGMEALAPVSPRTGVLYPLQTFSKGSPVDISEVPFFTEAARDADYDIIDNIARSISAHVLHADAERRRVLHIAGVFTSNFPNILLECTERILARGGYSLDVVRPLMQATVTKAFAAGPHAAQTGPARRGDFDVIARQQEALPDDLKPVYSILTDLILHSHGIKNEQNKL